MSMSRHKRQKIIRGFVIIAIIAMIFSSLAGMALTLL